MMRASLTVGRLVKSETYAPPGHSANQFTLSELSLRAINCLPVALERILTAGLRDCKSLYIYSLTQKRRCRDA